MSDTHHGYWSSGSHLVFSVIFQKRLKLRFKMSSYQCHWIQQTDPNNSIKLPHRCHTQQLWALSSKIPTVYMNNVFSQQFSVFSEKLIFWTPPFLENYSSVVSFSTRSRFRVLSILMLASTNNQNTGSWVWVLLLSVFSISRFVIF